MSQIIRSAGVGSVRMPGRSIRLLTVFGVAAVLIAGLALTVALVGDRSVGSAPTSAGAAAPALGRSDDYGLRHGPQAPVLGRSDDYGLRHAPQAPVLGRSDDYATRQRELSQQAGPPLSRIDDYGTRHGSGG